MDAQGSSHRGVHGVPGVLVGDQQACPRLPSSAVGGGAAAASCGCGTSWSRLGASSGG